MKFAIFLLLSSFFALQDCSRSPQSNDNSRMEYIEHPESSTISKDVSDTATGQDKRILKEDKEFEYYEYPEIKYRREVIKSGRDVKRIRSEYRYSEKNKLKNHIFKSINRKDLRFFRRKDTILVPDTIYNNILAYSPFPAYYEAANEIPKIVMVSGKIQAYGCYEYGNLVYWAPVCTGKRRRPSPPGRYSVNWKSKNHVSSIDSTWEMPYTLNIHRRGMAMHQFVLPGFPASHRCIRQLYDDAKWLFYWTKGPKRKSGRGRIPNSGTPVIIFDAYDFTHIGYRHTRKPWLEVASNRESIIQLPQDPLDFPKRWKHSLKDSNWEREDQKRAGTKKDSSSI